MMLCSGCAASRIMDKKHTNPGQFASISEQEAKNIAKNKLLQSPGDVYKKVYFDQPQVQHIDWDYPENKWMKENIKGYYQKFQEHWSIRFSPKYDKSGNNLGCQVWVDKIKGDAQVSCAPYDL